jgi:hypothetical protein
MRATVTSRSNAVILMRARKSGVTSIVNRAVKGRRPRGDWCCRSCDLSLRFELRGRAFGLV